MEIKEGGCFDPETIQLLEIILEQAWATLSPSQQRTALKSDLARRVLSAASRGERNPDRLRAVALMRPMERSGGAKLKHKTLRHSEYRGGRDILSAIGNQFVAV